MEHVRLTPADDIEELAELERWEEEDRKSWSRIAHQFDDWILTLDPGPSRVTATSGEAVVSEPLRSQDSHPTLDALVRLSGRLGQPPR